MIYITRLSLFANKTLRTHALKVGYHNFQPKKRCNLGTVAGRLVLRYQVSPSNDQVLTVHRVIAIICMINHYKSNKLKFVRRKSVENKANLKKTRAVIATIALVMAVNFAISHAEYVYSTAVFGLNNHSSLESNRSSYFPATIVNPQHAQKPSKSVATDASTLPSAPRPHNSLAFDASTLPSAPRPSNSLASDAITLQRAQELSNSHPLIMMSLQSAPRPS